MRLGRHRHRRLLAITTALLWLFAVEVLPNLHLAAHADDHTHAADGSIHRHAGTPTRDEPHAHGGARHRHRRPYPAPPSVEKRGPSPVPAAPASRGRSPFPELAEPSVGHAALGVTHRALATLEPPPPCLTPVGEPVATAWTHTIETTAVIATPYARPNARGPPRV